MYTWLLSSSYLVITWLITCYCICITSLLPQDYPTMTILLPCSNVKWYPAGFDMVQQGMQLFAFWLVTVVDGTKIIDLYHSCYGSPFHWGTSQTDPAPKRWSYTHCCPLTAGKKLFLKVIVRVLIYHKAASRYGQRWPKPTQTSILPTQ